MPDALDAAVQSYCEAISGELYLPAKQLMANYDGLIVIDAQSGFFDQLAEVGMEVGSLPSSLFDLAYGRLGELCKAAKEKKRPRYIVEYEGFGDTDEAYTAGGDVFYVVKRDNDGSWGVSRRLNKHYRSKAKKMRWLAAGLYLDQCVHDTVSSMLKTGWNIDVCVSASSFNMFGAGRLRGTYNSVKWWSCAVEDVDLNSLNFTYGTRAILRDLKGHMVA